MSKAGYLKQYIRPYRNVYRANVFNAGVEIGCGQSLISPHAEGNKTQYNRQSRTTAEPFCS